MAKSEYAVLHHQIRCEECGVVLWDGPIVERCGMVTIIHTGLYHKCAKEQAGG